MSKFKNEIPLIVGLVQAVLTLVVGMGLGLSTEQAGLVTAALSAVLGVVVAISVRPVSPAVFVAAVNAVIALAIGFGAHLSPEFASLIDGVVVAVLALIGVRAQVSPVGKPAISGHERRAL